MTIMVLFLDLAYDELFHLVPVKLDQETCKLLHDLVERRVLGVLELLAGGIAVLVDDNEDLLGFGHFKTDNFHDLVEDLWVD